MPGLTATLTAPYEGAINGLLSLSDSIGSEEVNHQLHTAGKQNVSALETALRGEFYRILSSTDINDAGFQRMWRLLDIVNIASDSRICDPALLFLLIEDLLESQTIHGCRKVFDYLESRREQLIEKNWLSKHLALLRSCNELLRRLSRAEDTVFCGRVFIFLFQSFPLADKSSVNLRGEYHTDNVTHYDRDELPEVDPNAMAVDPTAVDAAPAAPTIRVEGKETVDTEVLYSTFWALQEFFAQPTKLFDSSNFGNFKSGLEKTMLKFTEVYREEPRTGPRSDEPKSTKRKLDSLNGNSFNPKYLTSRDMFELEIHDPAFRRHILVQALIVADFLLSQTARSKAKMESLRNRSVIYDYVLSDDDVKWTSDLRAEIASYLQKGADGKYYYRMVDNVLSRDKNWLRWKAESCPPFSLDPVKPEEFANAHKSLQRTVTPRQIKKTPMSALSLDFLGADDQESSDSLERYRDPERWERPELANLRNDIATTEMDLEMADGKQKEDLEGQRSSQTWRALRIGGRFSLLDKLDMQSRDGLDPLFGIEKEPEANNEEASEEAEGAASPDNGSMEVDAEDDSTDPTDTVAPGDELHGDAAEPYDQHAEDTTNSQEETAQDNNGAGVMAEAGYYGHSAESSLSPIDSEEPTAENSWVEEAKQDLQQAASEDARKEEE